jgi:hypothetical protein
MIDISTIYQRWLSGDLAQEDALFAIGDVLRATEQERHGAAEAGHLQGQCASAALPHERASTETNSDIQEPSNVEKKTRVLGSGRG